MPTNVYLTPSFLEEQRRSGVKPDTIADFISSKIPDFKSQYTQVRMATKSDPRAIDAFLNWRIYGTAKPDPSIVAQPLTPEEEGLPDEPGFFGRIAGRVGDAVEGIRQAGTDYNRRSEEIERAFPDSPGRQLEEKFHAKTNQFFQSAGNVASGILSPATETLSTASKAVGLDQLAGAGAEAASQLPIAGTLVRDAKEGLEAYGQLAAKAPGEAGAFEAVTKAVGDSAEVYGAAQLAAGAKQIGKKAIQGGKEFFASEPALAGVAQEKADKAIQKLVQPKADKRFIQETAKGNPSLFKKQKAGVFRKGSIAPSEAEVKLAETAKSIPGFGQTDDVIDNADVVWKAKKAESNSLLSELQANDAVLSHKEMNSAVNDAIEKVAQDFPGEEGAVRRIGEIWKNEAAKYPGKASGHWQSRIGFDDLVENRYGPTIFQKGTARAEAVRAVRQAANSMIDRAAKNAGTSFSPKIKRISQMYDILDNLSTKMGEDTLRSGASKFLRTPAGRTAAGVAAGAGATTLGINYLRQ